MLNESALDGKQMGILRRILDDPEVNKLHPVIQPVVPMNVDDSQAFRADIARGERVQHVGYWTWHGEGPNNPDADKIEWKEAGGALESLIEWAHTIKGYNPLKLATSAQPNDDMRTRAEAEPDVITSPARLCGQCFHGRFHRLGTPAGAVDKIPSH